ncbi:QsdR family transcriptional regulator [uncultured Amnibacterium sp.]|uniref:QsdR family transcriptional regulator n=1 Tax=uncultured Amnibacterium sp. TaxID=1631851 RepID=UPI0035CABFB3
MVAVAAPARETGVGSRGGLGSRGVELIPSRLSARLDEHADAARAFRAARHRFLGGERVDMGQLAARLGVERTSLFRWVGNRDELLAEVLWSLAVPTIDQMDAAVPLHGADRVQQLLSRFVDALIENTAFRTFLAREPARALRLLTARHSPVHRRFVAVVEALLQEELAAGFMLPVLPAHDLAGVLVRIAESFAYADLIAGEVPDAARASAAFALVLRSTRPSLDSP